MNAGFDISTAIFCFPVLPGLTPRNIRVPLDFIDAAGLLVAEDEFVDLSEVSSVFCTSNSDSIVFGIPIDSVSDLSDSFSFFTLS